MFRVNAAHLGVYISPHAPRLRGVAWRFRTGGRVIASPTIAGGIVYIGSPDHTLYALHLRDGSLLWKFATKGAVNSSAAVWGGRVYVSSLDGGVYALDAATGRLVWRFATGGERRYTSAGLVMPPAEITPDAWDFFLSSPTVSGGVVFVGSGDHNVYALDAARGILRWKFTTGDVVHASPAVSGGAVYIGSWDRFLYKLDARSGALRWKFATIRQAAYPSLSGIPSSAAVARGLVYFGSRDGHLYAVDAATGRLRWQHDDHGSWVVASPAVAGSAVYFTTSDELRFFGLDAATGRLRIALSYGTYSFSSPAISGTTAYFGTFDGRLYAVNIRTGHVTASFRTSASRKNAPKYLDAEGHVRAATYGDGTFEANVVGINGLLSMGSILSSPAIAEGKIVFGSADGTVYALN